MSPGQTGGGTPAAHESNARRRVTRRSFVVVAVLGAIAALVATTRTWITVSPNAGALTTTPIDVAGSDAATAVAALAVMALAAAVAATIAGRVARYVIAVLLAGSGAGIAASAVAVLANPVAAAATAVGEAAGRPRIDADYAVSAWPALAIGAGAWILASAVVLAVAGRRWTASRKYAAPAAQPGAAGAGPATEEDLDQIDGWDSFSRGDDPTR